MHKDLQLYSYDLPCHLPDVVSVGWLEAGETFETGFASREFSLELKALILRENVNQMRGYHYCGFCSCEEIRIIDGEKKRKLGSSEIWIPNPNSNIIYAAPNLILYYIEKHQYLPPAEFISAVTEFDPTSNWLGEVERKKRLQQAGL